jgi:WD40 repeat protein
MRTLYSLVLALLFTGWSAAADPAADANGDPLPTGAVARLGAARLRHPGRFIAGLAFSPDGKLLATAGGGPFVVLWDPADGKEVKRLDTRGRSAGGVRFSADGKLLAAGGDGAVVVWETAGWKERLRLPTDGPARRVGFTPDGKRVVAIDPRGDPGGADAALCHWDADTGRELKRVLASSAGPDRGPSLEVRFFADTAPDTRRGEAGAAALGRAPGGLAGASDLTPDGKWLVVYNGGKYWVWDLEKNVPGRLIDADANPAAPPALAVAPDGKRLVAFGQTTAGGKPSGEYALAAYDLETGKPLYKTTKVRPRPADRPGGQPETRLVMSPDGKVVAGASGSVVDLWEVETGTRRDLPGGDDPCLAAASVRFSADGKFVATLAPREGPARVWEAETGKLLLQSPEKAYTLALSADGKLLFTGNDSGAGVTPGLHLWDAAGKGAGAFADAPKQRVEFASFFDQDRKLATADAEGKITLWDVESRKPLKDQPAGRLKKVFAVAADGKTAVVSAGDRPALWDLEAGKPAGKTPAVDVRFANSTVLALAPDGLTLAGFNSGQQTVWVWDVEKGAWLAAPLPARAPKEAVLALSPEKKLLAVGDKVGDRVRVWDLATQREQGAANTGQGGVEALAFSPDGKRLLTAGADGSLLVWDAAKLEAPPKPAFVELRAARLRSLWDRLSAPYEDEKYQALWDLVDAGPSAVAFFRENIKPAEAGAPKAPAADLQKQQYAIEIMQYQGTDEARKFLGELAAGKAEAALTKAAKAALERIDGKK